MNTEELIMRAKDNDKIAIRILKKEVEPIALEILKRYTELTTIIPEQLLKESYKVFHKTILDYDPKNKHHSFYPLLRTHIKRQMLLSSKSSASKKYKRSELLYRYLFLKNERTFQKATVRGTHDIYIFKQNERSFTIAVPNEELPWIEDIFVGKTGERLSLIKEPLNLPDWFETIVLKVQKKQLNSKRLLELFE